jgi:hypothetical protein
MRSSHWGWGVGWSGAWGREVNENPIVILTRECCNDAEFFNRIRPHIHHEMQFDYHGTSSTRNVIRACERACVRVHARVREGGRADKVANVSVNYYVMWRERGMKDVVGAYGCWSTGRGRVRGNGDGGQVREPDDSP